MTIVFTVGYCGNNDAAYTNLMNQIRQYWITRLPPGTNMIMSRWDRDVVASVAAVSASEKLVLAGHSFGGCRALQAARQLGYKGRKVDGLILIDPVSYIWWGPDAAPRDWDGKPIPKPYGIWAGNNWDFIVPANVGKTWCYWRAARQMPWSAPVRGMEIPCTTTVAAPNQASSLTTFPFISNYCYTPKSNDVNVAHGEYVWNTAPIQAAASFAGPSRALSLKIGPGKPRPATAKITKKAMLELFSHGAVRA